MKKISARKIAVTAIFLALIAIFMFTPLGFLGGFAFFFIMTVCLAAQLEGLWTGVICSTFFGLASFLGAIVAPGPLSFIFSNPVASILPRIPLGFVAYYVFKLFKKLFANAKSDFVKEILPSAISAAVTVTLNTALVLGVMAIGWGTSVYDGGTIFDLILGTLLIINYPVELAVCIIITPPVYYGVKRALNKGRKTDVART